MRLAAFVLILASCSRRDSTSADRFHTPACKSTSGPIAQEEASDLGRLHTAWRTALADTMKSYDAVFSGRQPAYEGFVWIGGVKHGPVQGLVTEHVVDGVTVRQLILDGPIETRVTISPRTPRQRGAFLVQVPSRVIECRDCIDLDAREVPFEPKMTFETESEGRVTRVELRRLAPDEIDMARATTLFGLTVTPAGGESVQTVRWPDVFVTVERPPGVAADHGSCELVLAAPPTLHIQTACPASWDVHFPSTAPRRTCCTRPRYHGPPQSGYYREDCIDAK